MPKIRSIAPVVLVENTVVIYGVDEEGHVWKIQDRTGYAENWTRVDPEPPGEAHSTGR